jgi:hypothetical protein
MGFVNNGIHKHKVFLAYYKLSTEDRCLRNGNYADFPLHLTPQYLRRVTAFLSKLSRREKRKLT